MKTRAQTAGVPFDDGLFTVDYLTEWLRTTKTCPCCGVELLQTYSFDRKVAKNSPSFDRLIPALGYVRGNVTLLCHRCNTLKSDMTVEYLERLLAWMKMSTAALYEACQAK